MIIITKFLLSGLLRLFEKLKLRIISEKEWQELQKQLILKEREIASALELASETEKEKENLRKELLEVKSQLQRLTMEIEIEKLNKQDKEKKTLKQKVLLVGGCPDRRNIVVEIDEKWKKYLEIQWFPSEKVNGKNKGWLGSLRRKVESADLCIIVGNYIGHHKQDVVLDVCRRNGKAYKIIPGLSSRNLQEVLNRFFQITANS